MNAFPNYNEFYQKPLIPIDKSDILTLSDNPFATHWLIAIEGDLADAGVRVDHWKVFVFLSNADGTFEYQNPYYYSEPIPSIHSAFEFVKEIENKCICGMLTSITSSENIV